VPARLLAPSLSAIGSCCGFTEESPYLQPKEFAASASFRWLHSFREFHGDQELPYPTDPALYANTHVYGFDFAVTYQVTPRFSLTLELPAQVGDRTSYYEHDFVHKFTSRASGIGDLKLIGTSWVFDPLKYQEGNVALSLGAKFPTGKYDATDVFHQPTGPVVRPVDPAIQPGDGGWGFLAEIAAFQQLYTKTYFYLQGVYLFNPRDINHVQQPTGNEPDFTLGEFGYIFNSVPDQYLGRLGLGYLLWPKYGLYFTLGARIEGVPVEDLIGDSNGFRTTGYAISIEPGLAVDYGRFSFSVTAPVAVHRHAAKNLTDIKVSHELNTDFGGNAAFADYLITASVSWRF
jgi:hypothetical protein